MENAEKIARTLSLLVDDFVDHHARAIERFMLAHPYDVIAICHKTSRMKNSGKLAPTEDHVVLHNANGCCDDAIVFVPDFEAVYQLQIHNNEQVDLKRVEPNHRPVVLMVGEVVAILLLNTERSGSLPPSMRH